MAQRSELTFTVDLCPRCGQQHDDLEFSQMGSGISVVTESSLSDGTASYTHIDCDLFATCPIKAEPVLARVVGEGEVEVR